MAEIIFGIDHGNGNMKGESVCFPCGLVRYVSEPGRFGIPRNLLYVV